MLVLGKFTYQRLWTISITVITPSDFSRECLWLHYGISPGDNLLECLVRWTLYWFWERYLASFNDFIYYSTIICYFNWKYFFLIM